MLTCGTGGGHNAAAAAIVEQARAEGETAEMVNFLALAGPIRQKALEQAYIKTVQNVPKLVGAVYGLAEQISSPDRHSPVYAANAAMSGHLEEYLRTHETDAVICTHLYPVEALTYLAGKGRLTQKTIAVATDYTCIPFWEETRCDWYIAAHTDCARESADRGLPAERILPYGIPVSRRFREPLPQTTARQQLGLKQEGHIYLVMGGSMGFGQIPGLCDALLEQSRPEDQVAVICGSHQKTYEQICQQYAENTQVHVVGFTDQVALYMAASDVLFTKPGGLSTTEAAVMRKPLVLTNPIPGCETANRELFVRRGMAVTADDEASLAWFGRQLAEDPERAEKMRRCQQKNIPVDAVERIVALARSIV